MSTPQPTFPDPSSIFRNVEDLDPTATLLGHLQEADTDKSSAEAAIQVQSQDASAPASPKASDANRKSLLTPSGKQPPLREQIQSHDQRDESGAGRTEPSGPGLGSMIEKLNGVEDRDDVPRKRRKVVPDIKEDDEIQQHRSFGSMASTGTVKEFFQEKREEAKETAATKLALNVVDLTMGE